MPREAKKQAVAIYKFIKKLFSFWTTLKKFYK